MDKLKSGISYRDAGVDISAGEAAVKAIKHKVRSTYNNNVLSDLGSFGGLYSVDLIKWKQPVLVSSTDGVGTKLRIAIMAGVYNTIGQDLVNHCVNDILVQGAIPQFFLDYIGVGKLNPAMIEKVIDGLITACKQNSCALIGGEMAEMPGIYQEEDFDLAGTIVGMVERDALLPRNIQAGDALIALPSSGLHTNGYSLVRKIVFEHLRMDLDTYVSDCNKTLGELLLAVHSSYLPILKDYLQDNSLHGLAHITGGGIAGNLSRILPRDLGAVIRLQNISTPPFFSWLKSIGNISDEVMRQTFNLGVGMILVVDKDSVDHFTCILGAKTIGELTDNASAKEKVEFV
ncbi:MAG: phosphoribosylformylglycinamidine cyclo-ligase [Candidatus Cloacimonetes bacterium]|nr:phosphoribosylformylglycinamidine cyclo-ligase [Candidatus Cloacimonadota bacterium]